MGEDENKRILRAAYDRWWSEGDVDAVDEMIADDYIDHSAVVAHGGKEGLKELIRECHQGFPDTGERLEDAIAEGDKVVGRFRMWVTHTGAFLGIPATGDGSTSRASTRHLPHRRRQDRRDVVRGRSHGHDDATRRRRRAFRLKRRPLTVPQPVST